MSSDDRLTRAIGSLACLLRWSGSSCSTPESDVLAALSALPEATPEAGAAAVEAAAAGKAKGVVSFAGQLAAAGYTEALRAYFTRFPSAANASALADVVSHGNDACVSTSLSLASLKDHAEWQALLFLALSNTPTAVPAIISAAPTDLALSAPARLACQLLRHCSLPDFRSSAVALSKLFAPFPVVPAPASASASALSPESPAADFPDTALNSIFTRFPPESLIDSAFCPLAFADHDAVRCSAALTHLIRHCAVPVTPRLLAEAAGAVPELLAAADARDECVSALIAVAGGAAGVFGLFNGYSPASADGEGASGVVYGLSRAIQGSCLPLLQALIDGAAAAGKKVIFPVELFGEFSRTLPPGCTSAAARDSPRCFAAAVAATLKSGGRFLPSFESADQAQEQARAQTELVVAAVGAGMPELLSRLLVASPALVSVAISAMGITCPATPAAGRTGCGIPATPAAARAAAAAEAERAAVFAAASATAPAEGATGFDKIPAWIPSLPLSDDTECDNYSSVLAYPLPSRVATASIIVRVLLPSLGPARALTTLFRELIGGAAASQGLCNVQSARATVALLPLPLLRAAAVGSGKVVCDVGEDGTEGTAVRAPNAGESASVAQRPPRSVASALALMRKIATAAGLPSLAPRGPVGVENGGSKLSLSVRAVLFTVVKLLPEGDEVDAAAIEALKLPKTTLIGIAVAAEAQAVAEAALKKK